MSSIMSAAGTANLALMSLNSITSQMSDAQARISSGKAVNGYADNPAVFYTATTMTNQQQTLKQSAVMLNNSPSAVNAAMGSVKTVQTALAKISTALNSLTDASATNATRTDLAQTVVNQMTALNSAINDDANASFALGRGSLLAGGANNGSMTINLGSGGSLTIQGINLSVQPNGVGGIGFAQSDVAAIVAMAKYGGGALTNATMATEAAAANATEGVVSTTTSAIATTVVKNAYADAAGRTTNADGVAYKAADVSATSGIALRKLTQMTTTAGLVTSAATFLTTAQAGLNNANAFGRNLGSAADAINTVLDNNTALQSSLGSQISKLVDADVAAEQVKLSALQVQQQLSVSALTSISQSRSNLLGLFR